MSQSENCNSEISVTKQDSKVNGKIDSIEGQLSFMGEGEREEPNTPAIKDENSFPLPTLSLFPKRFDDSQDAPDDLRNVPDLPNGHNNPDAVDISPRTKSLDELLQESEELPDTELIGCTKEFVESKTECNTSSDNGGDEAKLVESESKKGLKEKNEEDTVENLKGNKDLKSKDNEITSELVSNSDDDLEKSGEISTAKQPEKQVEDKTSKSEDSKKSELSLGNEKTRKETTCEDKNGIERDTNKSDSDKLKDESVDDSFKLELSDSQLISDSVVEERKDKLKSTDEKIEESKKENEVVKDREMTDNFQIAETSLNTSPTVKEEVKKEKSEECLCVPECHKKMKLLKNCLGNACNQLDNFIKLKKQEELRNFLKLLTEIELITENKKTDVSQDLLTDAFQEERQTNKKRKPRTTKTLIQVEGTPKKEIPEKRSRHTKSEEPMTEINFKNLKGLAVFAKWPNSGWYYPGIIEGFTNSDWKEATNVTVKFYDGLVREMKNINILPAHLIPASSTVCDLDDETEMVVINTNRIDNNCVEFTLSTKEGAGKNLEVNFNKLAIKALHMKAIKQQLEPNTDVIPKKMHMVSLDNLVSGRRTRIRTHKDDDDENPENTTPRKNVRKSAAPTVEKSPVDESINIPATPSKTAATPSKRNGSQTVRSTLKRSGSTKRMKQ